jgi:hypothetical protein
MVSQIACCTRRSHSSRFFLFNFVFLGVLQLNFLVHIFLLLTVIKCVFIYSFSRRKGSIHALTLCLFVFVLQMSFQLLHLQLCWNLREYQISPLTPFSSFISTANLVWTFGDISRYKSDSICFQSFRHLQTVCRFKFYNWALIPTSLKLLSFAFLGIT